MEFIWGGNIFPQFFSEPMQRESDFGGRKYFFSKTPQPPPPPAMRVNLCVPEGDIQYND